MGRSKKKQNIKKARKDEVLREPVSEGHVEPVHDIHRVSIYAIAYGLSFFAFYPYLSTHRIFWASVAANIVLRITWYRSILTHWSRASRHGESSSLLWCRHSLQ